jgi:acetyl-CoA carboxylase biotin carboxyl carrier protein
VSAGPAPGPGAFDAEARGAFDDPRRVVATSPAVGFFRPAADRGAGDRVRAGDRLGVVDVLGVPHELVAPVDGIVGASLAESGEPVEYGQALVEIELLGMPTAERGEGS